MKNVFFSVIIPVYNAEDYLSECFDSVLAQTYRKFEIIAVDDGSTDKSGEICDMYARKDERIRVFHRSNGGVLSARCQGIKSAGGDYCLFLDSDDTFAENALSVLNEEISESSCDCVIFGMDRVRDGKTVLAFVPEFDSKKVISDKKELYKTLFFGEQYNSMCIKAVKKSIFYGFDYSDFFGKISHGEDRLQAVEIAKNATSVLFLTQPLYNYRMNPESVTHKEFDPGFRQDYTLARYVYNFLKNEKLFSENDFSVYFGKYVFTMIKWIKLIACSDCATGDKVKSIRSYKEDDFYNIIKNSSPYTGDLILKDKIVYWLFKLGMFRTIVRICNIVKH